MSSNGFPSVAPVSEHQAFQILRPFRRPTVPDKRKGGAHHPSVGLTKKAPPSSSSPRSAVRVGGGLRPPAPSSGSDGSDVDDYDNYDVSDDNNDDDDDAHDDEDKADKKSKKKKKHEHRKVRPGSYEALGLNPAICSALHAAGYNFPTPIQRKVIPAMLAGDDVVAMARTGSGKTAAFLAPLLHRLSEGRQSLSAMGRRNGPRALVVAPTRELVLQEVKFCNLYAKRLERGQVRMAVVVGGTPLEAQFEALAVCPDIIFATPGRLLQIVAEMNAGHKSALTLSTAETLILDEADRLFEGTLAYETHALLDLLRDRATESFSRGGSSERQTVLVSATMPHALKQLSKTGLRKCLSVVRLDADKSMSPTVAASFIYVRADFEKDAALTLVVRRVLECAANSARSSVVVFAATHRRVEYLTELLRVVLMRGGGGEKDNEHVIGSIHGGMDQLARQETVARFRKKRTKVLVVTDVAARGIDLPDLDVVVNYDVAATPKLFVHRVGRVGRAGRFGVAFNLVSSDELGYMLDVLLYLGREVKFASSGGANEEEHDQEDQYERTFDSDGYCMETTFTLGAVPKAAMDEQVETIRDAVRHIELAKMLQSAKNAHKLYIKTRGIAGGESIRRAKRLFDRQDTGGKEQEREGGGGGGKVALHVHPWFSDLMHAGEAAAQQSAAEHVARLSAWRPKECAVAAPSGIVARKERRQLQQQQQQQAVGQVSGLGKDKEDEDRDGAVGTDAMEEDGSKSGCEESDAGKGISVAKGRGSTGKKNSQRQQRTKTKVSARQAQMEEQRGEFFLQAHVDLARRRDKAVMRVAVPNSNSSAHATNARHELDDAAMDITADANEDLLRASHTQRKYWDRVSKKFVRGDGADGVGGGVSKRNMHVASNEARARAKVVQDRTGRGKGKYSEDGVHYRKWLSKHGKSVQLAAEAAAGEGDGEGASGLGDGIGLRVGGGVGGMGQNDFRRGAFGRKGRVAIAKKVSSADGGANEGGKGKGAGAGDELKAKEVIRKERRVKAKAAQKKGRRKKDNDHYIAPQRGQAKSRVIVRRK